MSTQPPLPDTGAAGRSGPHPAAGAAIAGTQCGGAADFVLVSGTVSFAANATDLLRTVYIQTCRDTQREIDEPLSLRVTGSRNVKLPAQPFVNGVVRDNQAPN